MMDSATLLESLKLPLIGGALLSLSSMNLMLDFSKVFGCSQALKSLQESYKLIRFHYFQNSNGQSNNNHILFNHQNLFIAAGLALSGSFLRLFMDFIERNLTHNERSIFDSSLLSNHVHHSRSDDHQVLKNVLLFTLAGLLSGAGTTLASGCTSGHMLCGMARGSKRSIVATCVFFPVAILTHRVLKPLLAQIGVFSQSDSMYQEYSESVSTIGSDQVICGAIFAAPFIAYLVLKLVVKPERWIPLRLGLLGATFGSGLTLSGMTKPSVVLGFFNFPLPTWDPSLLGVAIAGLGLNTLVYWLERPLLDKLDRLAPPCATPPTWQLPEMTNNEITTRLVLGSVLFGLGWGLAGVCPGPALVVFGAYPLSFVMWGWLAGFFAGSHFIR
ncbi:uncharacterized protein PGTG_19820 [Puccinia graminis f. sp. tritici CRL 75-36-700-3]|uniref:Sulphur transport domain-containing protein n=1 Tax=Puccinia graminis f. sp. tritici (strain CRL 75-36-700-3 / race SCCL) TaxID=418459 RepID=E3LB84_PUCGT|nr:uncharacterized protein PGTG_19820 [Puccinia graminis f. sp. tritici CRL 75-36-700-3]EFP93809.2 hypothetical protein PGTG_19820 [Puccinia graminis f. sp. tritici CRL 75-36-700-3]